MHLPGLVKVLQSVFLISPKFDDICCGYSCKYKILKCMMIGNISGGQGWGWRWRPASALFMFGVLKCGVGVRTRRFKM